MLNNKMLGNITKASTIAGKAFSFIVMVCLTGGTSLIWLGFKIIWIACKPRRKSSLLKKRRA